MPPPTTQEPDRLVTFGGHSGYIWGKLWVQNSAPLIPDVKVIHCDTMPQPGYCLNFATIPGYACPVPRTLPIGNLSGVKHGYT